MPYRQQAEDLFVGDRATVRTHEPHQRGPAVRLLVIRVDVGRGRLAATGAVGHVLLQPPVPGAVPHRSDRIDGQRDSVQYAVSFGVTYVVRVVPGSLECTTSVRRLRAIQISEINNPMAPTIMRMTPAVPTSKPLVLWGCTANLRIAPIAIRARLAPILMMIFLFSTSRISP